MTRKKLTKPAISSPQPEPARVLDRKFVPHTRAPDPARVERLLADVDKRLGMPKFLIRRK